MDRNRAAPPEVRAALLDYLGRDDRGRPAPFRLDPRTIDSKVRGLIHLAMSTSTYQLN